MSNYRNRQLLDLAHRICECQNCGAYSPEGCEPAHSNQQRHGKGKSIKAHDCYFAALCHACHFWLDQSSKMSPCGRWGGHQADKRDAFHYAADKTLLLLWQNGWIKVGA